MRPGQSRLIGIAGVHYVSSRLSAMGYHAAPTSGNVPNVDLLVSSFGGAKSISLQVKTTTWALRTRGRGEQKKPHHYQWEIGWKLAKPKLAGPPFFALVDLKESEELPQLPDVFIIPSSVIYRYFKAGPQGWPRARYHEKVRKLEKYKNAWQLLEKKLA